MLISAYLVPHPPIILPEVGRGQEAPAEATISGMKDFGQELAEERPEVLVVLSPHGHAGRTHEILLGSEITASLRQFGVGGEGPSFSLADKLSSHIADEAEIQGLPLKGRRSRDPLDHGAFVPLHFIREAGHKDFSLLLISTGAPDLPGQEELGALIQGTLNAFGKPWSLILSGDLSHRMKADGPYGYHPAGPIFEEAVAASVLAGSLDALLALDPHTIHDAAPCAQGPLALGWAILSGLKLQTEIYSHEAPFGVGYMVARLFKEA